MRLTLLGMMLFVSSLCAYIYGDMPLCYLFTATAFGVFGAGMKIYKKGDRKNDTLRN